MGSSFNLEHLKQKMPFKWRVQSFSKNKKSASCVAYVDSRQVQDLLDDIVGPENWQDSYTEHKGNLFCSIGIKINGEWVWKSDCGTESNVDKQKGESSDAFKRSAVKWGIGRFLYSLEVAWVDSNEVKTTNPVNWPYVVDSSGKKVWDLTKHINAKNGNQNANAQPNPLPCPREYLKTEYLTGNWNGVIYVNSTISLNNTMFCLSVEQVDWVKKHPNYKASL